MFVFLKRHRLDRIQGDTAIYPIQKTWKPELDFIEVEFHALRQLAFAYQTQKDSDLANDWHPNLPNIRRVIRKVSSTFWLFREVRCYGPDCAIVSPATLRDRFVQDLTATLAQYSTASTAPEPELTVDGQKSNAASPK